MSIRRVRSEGVSMRAGRSKSHSGCTRKRLEQSLKTKSKTKSSNGKAQHIIIPHNRLHRSPTNLAAGIHHHHLGRQLQKTKSTPWSEQLVVVHSLLLVQVEVLPEVRKQLLVRGGKGERLLLVLAIVATCEGAIVWIRELLSVTRTETTTAAVHIITVDSSATWATESSWKAACSSSCSCTGSCRWAVRWERERAMNKVSGLV